MNLALPLRPRRSCVMQSEVRRDRKEKHGEFACSGGVNDRTPLMPFEPRIRDVRQAQPHSDTRHELF
jgi:hypothetical protein